MIKVLLLFVVICLTGASDIMAASGLKSERKIKRLQDQIVKKELQLNRMEVDTYIRYIRQNQMTIPIYSLGSNFTDPYVEQSAVVKKARKDFERKDSVLQEVLMKDAVYREADSTLRVAGFGTPDFQKSKRTKQDVFARLNKTSEEYRDARKTRDNALYLSNVVLLEVIAREFQEKKWVLALPFLDDPFRQKLEKMNPRIGLLRMELDALRGNYMRLLSVVK